MLVLVLLEHGVPGLVIDGQVELGEVDQLRVELPVLDSQAMEPACDGGADPARAGAAEDDVKPECQG
jgi:hypothetical protein